MLLSPGRTTVSSGVQYFGFCLSILDVRQVWEASFETSRTGGNFSSVAVKFINDIRTVQGLHSGV